MTLVNVIPATNRMFTVQDARLIDQARHASGFMPHTLSLPVISKLRYSLEDTAILSQVQTHGSKPTCRKESVNVLMIEDYVIHQELLLEAGNLANEGGLHLDTLTQSKEHNKPQHGVIMRTRIIELSLRCILKMVKKSLRSEFESTAAGACREKNHILRHAANVSIENLLTQVCPKAIHVVLQGLTRLHLMDHHDFKF